MQNNKLTLDEFRNIVIEQYSFLTIEHGFSLQQTSEWLYVAENPYCRIRIFLEHGYPVVDLEPIGEGARQLRIQNMLPRQIGVGVITEILDPDQEIGSSFKTIDEQLATDIKSELEKGASHLKSHCEPMLKGDFSKWSQVESGLKLRRSAFYKRFKKKGS